MDGLKHKTSSGLGRAIATLAAIVGTLLVNTLSNFFPPGGENVGEIANTILSGVLITPANYAFAIWGVIYVGLIAYGCYQLGGKQRQDLVIQRVSQCLIIACMAQMVWIFLFTLRYFALSVVAMLAILLPLILSYQTLNAARLPGSRARRWYARYPFSIYLAWISVATVVNVASALYAANWSGWGLSDTAWTVVMIAVTALIGVGVTVRQRDIPFALVFIWAYGAIAVRHADTLAIWIAAAIAAVVLLLILGIARLQGWRN